MEDYYDGSRGKKVWESLLFAPGKERTSLVSVSLCVDCRDQRQYLLIHPHVRE